MAEIHVRDFTSSFQAMQRRHADEVLQATCEIAQDWESFVREQDQQSAADQDAAEALLVEAQERIEQKDKQIAVLEQKLAGSEASAAAFAEAAYSREDERDDLEVELDDLEGKCRFHWWASAVFAGLFFASLAIHATR